MKPASKKRRLTVVPVAKTIHPIEPPRSSVKVELEQAIYMTCICVAELVKTLGVLEKALERTLQQPENGSGPLKSDHARPTRLPSILTT